MDVYTNVAATQANGAFWNLALLTMIVIFILYSGILIYHWYAYSLETKTTTLMTITYLALSIVFIVALIVSRASI